MGEHIQSSTTDIMHTKGMFTKSKILFPWCVTPHSQNFELYDRICRRKSKRFLPAHQGPRRILSFYLIMKKLEVESLVTHSL